MVATPQNKVGIAGSFNGGAHTFTPMFSGGKSLHPLQRNGQASVGGMPVVRVGAVPGVGAAPSAKGMDLTYPNTLRTSATLATQASYRVS